MKRFVIAALLALIPGLAFGQASVRQNGTITPYHMGRWIQDHIIEDAGGLMGNRGRGVDPYSIYDVGGNGVCSIDNLTTSAYSQICIGHDGVGTPTIFVNDTNSPHTVTSIELDINGNKTSLPGTASCLGCGDMAGQNHNNVNITGGTITGVTVMEALNSGNIFVGNGSNVSVGVPMSGDCSMANTGAITCLKTGGALLRGMALQDPAAVNITGGTASNLNLITPAITGGTQTSPAITTPTITGGTQTNPTVTGGIFFPTRSTKATSYTLVNADCSSKISLTGGANQTLTLPGGMTTNCQALVSNETSHAWNITATGISTFFIWPGQSCRFDWSGSVWTSNCPYRLARAGLALYVGPPTCSDANDGLSSDSAGRLCHINTAISRIQTSIDTQMSVPTINLLAGAFTEAAFMAAQPTGGADQISIVGAGIGSTTVIAPTGNAAFGARDYGVLTISNLTIGCIGAAGVSATQFSTIDMTNVQFGSCDAGNMAQAANGGHVNCTGGITIAGNAAAFLYAADRGEITCTTLIGIAMPVNFTNSFVEAAGAGSAIVAPGMTFSNAGFVSGNRYIIAGLAEIDTGGSGVNFFPGSAPGINSGTFPTGGYYH